MTAPSLAEIHAQQSAYVRRSGITIKTVPIRGEVTLNDGVNSLFIDGDAGSDFIADARRIWNSRGDVTMAEANEIVAYNYADILGEL